MEYTTSVSNYITDNLRLFPDIGNVVPYEDLCQLLFASKIDDISRIELIHKGFVVNANDENDKTIYFIIEKLFDFIKFCYNKVDLKKPNICPINFYNILQSMSPEINIPQVHTKIFNILSDFKNFLIQKEDINAKIILNYYWNNTFRGIITTYNESPFMMTIKFIKKEGFPFIMNLCEFQTELKNVVCINTFSQIRLDEFEKLFNTWTQEIKMDNSDNYVISCLECVTGSRDMAEFIFKSHKDKLSYVIDVNNLNQIINFASPTKKSNYLVHFKKIYENRNFYQLEENIMYLNFEGFNKYLLNLESSYLYNFQEKENINDLYYNIMDELVNSYQRLYDHTKL
jgi:hypothetical protein